MMPPADLISSTINSAQAYFSPCPMVWLLEDLPQWCQDGVTDVFMLLRIPRQEGKKEESHNINELPDVRKGRNQPFPHNFGLCSTHTILDVVDESNGLTTVPCNPPLSPMDFVRSFSSGWFFGHLLALWPTPSPTSPKGPRLAI